MTQDSCTNTRRPAATDAITDWIKKNIIWLLNFLVMLVLLYSNINNDVGNINKSLEKLSFQVTEMGIAIRKLEDTKTKVDYLERDVDRISRKLDNLVDLDNTRDLVNSTKMSELKTRVDQLERKR